MTTSLEPASPILAPAASQSLGLVVAVAVVKVPLGALVSPLAAVMDHTLVLVPTGPPTSVSMHCYCSGVRPTCLRHRAWQVLQGLASMPQRQQR